MENERELKHDYHDDIDTAWFFVETLLFPLECQLPAALLSSSSSSSCWLWFNHIFSYLFGFSTFSYFYTDYNQFIQIQARTQINHAKILIFAQPLIMLLLLFHFDEKFNASQSYSMIGSQRMSFIAMQSTDWNEMEHNESITLLQIILINE